jgi:hypothetical protein
MSEVIALHNPTLDIMNTLTYSQKVAQTFWENTNTLDTQDRTTAKGIDKRLEFLSYNLEKMMDLPKIPNFDRTEATSIALWLDRIRERFSSLDRSELRELLEVLEPLRK